MSSGYDDNGQVVPPTPNEVAKAITGRDYLSYSQVTTYQACPLKWHFTYVENAASEQQSASLLLGSGVHAAIEHHLRAQMAADEAPSVTDLLEVFRQEWKNSQGEAPIRYGKDETADSQLELAGRMLEAYLASEQAYVQGQLIGVEEELRATLAVDVPDLLAVVDKIELRAGELLLTDFKTARTSWKDTSAAEHADQLLLYAQVAAEIANDFGVQVGLEFVVITKAASPKVSAIPITYDAKRSVRTTKVVREVFKSMQLGVVYPNPSAMNLAGDPVSSRTCLGLAAAKIFLFISQSGP